MHVHVHVQKAVLITGTHVHICTMYSHPHNTKCMVYTDLPVSHRSPDISGGQVQSTLLHVEMQLPAPHSPDIHWSSNCRGGW